MRKVRTYIWKTDRDLFLSKDIRFNANDANSDIVELVVSLDYVGVDAVLLIKNSNEDTVVYNGVVSGEGKVSFMIDRSFSQKDSYQLAFRLIDGDVVVESNCVSYRVIDGFEAGSIIVPENTLEQLDAIIKSITDSISDGTATIDGLKNEIKNAENALSDLGIALEEVSATLGYVSIKVEEANKAIEEINISKADIETLVATSIASINSAKEVAIKAVEDGLEEITSTTSSGVAQITNIKNSSVNEITTLKTSSITEITSTKTSSITEITNSKNNAVDNILSSLQNSLSSIVAFTNEKKSDLEVFKNEKIDEIEESIDTNKLNKRQETLEWRMDRLEVFKLGDAPNPKLGGILGSFEGRFGYYMANNIKPVGIENVVNWQNNGIFADFEQGTTPVSYDFAGQTKFSTLKVGYIEETKLDGRIKIPLFNDMGELMEVIYFE